MASFSAAGEIRRRCSSDSTAVLVCGAGAAEVVSRYHISGGRHTPATDCRTLARCSLHARSSRAKPGAATRQPCAPLRSALCRRAVGSGGAAFPSHQRSDGYSQAVRVRLCAPSTTKGLRIAVSSARGAVKGRRSRAKRTLDRLAERAPTIDHAPGGAWMRVARRTLLRNQLAPQERHSLPMSRRKPGSTTSASWPQQCGQCSRIVLNAHGSSNGRGLRWRR